MERTELTKILGKSYDHADFKNVLGNSQQKLTPNLRKSCETPRKVCKKLTYENLRKIAGRT